MPSRSGLRNWIRFGSNKHYAASFSLVRKFRSTRDRRAVDRAPAVATIRAASCGRSRSTFFYFLFAFNNLASAPTAARILIVILRSAVSLLARRFFSVIGLSAAVAGLAGRSGEICPTKDLQSALIILNSGNITRWEFPKTGRATGRLRNGRLGMGGRFRFTLQSFETETRRIKLARNELRMRPNLLRGGRAANRLNRA
jgi:hypothetical protein